MTSVMMLGASVGLGGLSAAALSIWGQGASTAAMPAWPWVAVLAVAASVLTVVFAFRGWGGLAALAWALLTVPLWGDMRIPEDAVSLVALCAGAALLIGAAETAHLAADAQPESARRTIRSTAIALPFLTLLLAAAVTAHHAVVNALGPRFAESLERTLAPAGGLWLLVPALLLWLAAWAPVPAVRRPGRDPDSDSKTLQGSEPV